MQSCEFSGRLAEMPPRAAMRLAALLDWAIAEIDDKIDAAGVEHLVTAAYLLYDKHIAPVDVPWIPDIAEPAVIDAPAKWLIAQTIRGFHQLVHRE